MTVEATYTPPKQEGKVTLELPEADARALMRVVGRMSQPDWERLDGNSADLRHRLYGALRKALP